MTTTGTFGAETEWKVTRIREHLIDQVEQHGELYIKSREIADAVEVDLSARQVGQFIGTLADRPINPKIERWAYTGGTTWRVRQK
jgi:hypothetical protein